MNPREKLIRRMQGGVLQARDLRRQGDLKGARDILEQVAADAKRAGVRSSEVSHGLAVICDESGDLVAAHRYLQDALEADPLAAEVVEFREVLAAHVRQALASPDRDDDDPAVPELYRLLVRDERIMVDPHLGMVRWLEDAGRTEEAVALANAIARLFPDSLGAWRLLVRVATSAGDRALVREAKSRAAKVQAARTREPALPLPTQSKARA